MNRYIFVILIASALAACVGTKSLTNIESNSTSDILEFAKANSPSVDWFSAQLKGQARSTPAHIQCRHKYAFVMIVNSFGFCTTRNRSSPN